MNEKPEYFHGISFHPGKLGLCYWILNVKDGLIEGHYKTAEVVMNPFSEGRLVDRVISLMGKFKLEERSMIQNGEGCVDYTLVKDEILKIINNTKTNYS